MNKKIHATVNTNGFCDDYKVIAIKMSRSGDRMVHTTARNITMRALEKFAAAMIAQYGASGDPALVARDANFQNAILPFLEEALLVRSKRAV